jgi:hypothetical protein
MRLINIPDNCRRPEKCYAASNGHPTLTYEKLTGDIIINQSSYAGGPPGPAVEFCRAGMWAFCCCGNKSDLGATIASWRYSHLEAKFSHAVTDA